MQLLFLYSHYLTHVSLINMQSSQTYKCENKLKKEWLLIIVSKLDSVSCIHTLKVVVGSIIIEEKITVPLEGKILYAHHLPR